jgi:ribosomal protein S14
MGRNSKPAQKETGPKKFSTRARFSAQTENRPTACSRTGRARAPGRNLGLGRESAPPPGPRRKPVDLSRSSQSDGRPRSAHEQNGDASDSGNPSPILLLLLLSLRDTAAAERVRERTGKPVAVAPPSGPLAGERVHPGVDASPSSGSVTAPYWRARARRGPRCRAPLACLGLSSSPSPAKPRLR